MIAIPCPACGVGEAMYLVDRGQHTALYACGCGHSTVVDRGCHNTCGCLEGAST